VENIIRNKSETSIKDIVRKRAIEDEIQEVHTMYLKM
jgi:hypothetical protein